jgi:hypothetical protein
MNKITSILEWLINWYHLQCNGDWEHQNGIHIVTLDNPGWHVTVSLENTPVEQYSFQTTLIERTEDDWLAIQVQNSLFDACGGPENLVELLNIFKRFIEEEKIELNEPIRQ